MKPPPSPVPVLLYHAVTTDPSRWIAPFTVTPATFARHMDLVARSGRTALTVEELRTGLCGDLPLPAHPVVVTFDDGFADLLDDVAPALAARCLPATVFVTTGFVGGTSPGGDRMLTWSGVRELEAAGLEIGAHSVTHAQLDTLRPSAAREEITVSRQQLQEATDQPVSSFAYPHGFSSPQVRRLVAAAGYDNACGVKNALSHVDDERWCSARLTVTPTTSDDTVAAWLSGRGARLSWTGDLPRTRTFRAYRRLQAALPCRAPDARPSW